MPQLRQLLERRANTWSAYQEVLGRNAEASELSAEDRAALDAAEADIRQLSGDIERLERAEALSARFEAINRDQPPTGGPGAATDVERYSAAFGAFLRQGLSGISDEHRALLQSGYVSGDELRAQGVATGAAGGFLVPQGFRAVMTETMKFFGGMLAVANIIDTETGNDLPWPSNDDTGNEGAYVAENVQHIEQDVTIGQKILKAHLCSSKITRVALQLIQDSAFDLDNWLPKKQGERIGRRGNRAFTTGTGTNEPEGVATNAVVGKTGAAGQVTSIIYDDIVDLEHSVDVAYRNERSRFMFHDLTLAKLRKLKDSEGRPLWNPSLEAGAPDRFNGRPYTINNDMAQMAASARSVLFGDFYAGYIIRRVTTVQTLRLTERYADFLQVGFLSFERHDGRPDDAGAIRAYQNPAA